MGGGGGGGVQGGHSGTLHSGLPTMRSSTTTTTTNLFPNLLKEHWKPGVQARVQCSRVPTLLGPPRAPWWLPPPTCRQLSRSRRKSSQLERPHPSQQGAAESVWQEQVCSEAEE